MRKVKRAKAKAPRKPARARGFAPRADAIEAALAGLAHEIRTPLNGILALSELIAAADLPAREREWATQVRGAAEHLAHLATLVVDGVRAERRGLVLRPAPFRPRALAEAVAATLCARAEAKGLSADIAIAADLPAEAMGDGVRLRAALENLADNAVKFTERGGVGMRARVARVRAGHRLTFEFSDSGIGLSRGEIARLFRPFAQANRGVAQRYGGAGLGLAFVRRVARAMEGDLTVESRPGEGSRFIFSATVKAAPSRAAEANGGLTNGAVSPRGLRVLCAEDNPYARVVLKTVLTELGHTVDFAGTGEAAVAAAGRGDYDAVLMDMALPGMDGLAATRAIRALGGDAARIPIVGVSGRTELRDAEAAKAAGMNAFLAKPVSPAALAETLASLSSD